MLVLRSAPSHTSRRIVCQTRRWLTAPHEPNKHKVTVTKISFSELPTGHVLPDGSHAAPIGDWLGGLEATKRLHHREKPSGSCIPWTQHAFMLRRVTI